MDYRREAVQRMQDFIEEHLTETISLSDLASSAMYSPWHAYRLFVSFTGLSPSDYIRRLRLAKSALMLRDEKKKVSEIAFEFGFGSIDGYQRAFNKEFGCNPKEYSQKPIPIYLFSPFGVNFDRGDIKNMEKTKNIFIQVVEKERRKVIIKRGIKATDYWTYGEEVGCDVWGLLMSMSPEPVSLWLPKQYVKAGTSVYVQGVEVPMDYSQPIPEGFDIIELPPAKYLLFQGEPFCEEEFEEAIQQVWSAIDKYDPKVIGLTWDDSNPRVQLEPRGDRGYMELRAVKKL